MSMRTSSSRNTRIRNQRRRRLRALFLNQHIECAFLWITFLSTLLLLWIDCQQPFTPCAAYAPLARHHNSWKKRPTSGQTLTSSLLSLQATKESWKNHWTEHNANVLHHKFDAK